MTVKMEEK